MNNQFLLLKDLSARLPYKVIVDIKYNKEHGSSDRLIICNKGSLMLNTDLIGLCIEKEIHLKPYLRPMSSMTIEEIARYRDLCAWNDVEYYEFGEWTLKTVYNDTWESIDYLNSIHVDYRDLIPMGLAIEVTKENNPYEKINL